MAQQTINVGASPNDGTGTPLRTAFQYTNSNFSELYTAVGPSGNNIVVPGNATITGDLTVDTSTLKVNSSANRVGVLTASPESELDVRGLLAIRGTPTFPSSGVGIESYYSAANTSSFIQSYDRGGGAFANLSYSALAHIWQINGGESMRLNSTGLGVGVASPVEKVDVAGNVKSNAWIGRTNISAPTADCAIYRPTDNTFAISTANTERFRVDISGNVGIGVTPSAWAAGYKVIQGQIGGFALSNDNSSNNQFRLSSNAYFDTTDNRWEYYGSSTATAYEQRAGEHRFFNAPSGTLNTAITFTQAMTLDASGRLLVGPTSANTSGGILQLSSGITFPATQVASSDPNTLDDYEEGTFTPTIGGTATYTAQTGRYVKIGNRVWVTIRLVINTAGTGDDYRISGLPFVVASTIAPISVGYFAGLKISVGYISGYANTGTSTITTTATTAASANITNGAGVITNNTDLAISCFYEV